MGQRTKVMGKLSILERADIDTLVNRREGETKLGEAVQTFDSANWEYELQHKTAKFVLLGIPEDIGVRANYGTGGTQSLWQPALKAILNVQQSKQLQGDCLLVLGALDLTEEMQQSANMDVESLRELVSRLDDFIYPVIQKIVAAKKIPIVIGGGHNNCFPLLKGISLAKDMPVNCINLDAHSDFRPMEGRHSGNGFRYAHREGFLNKYEVVGLHENYNAQNIVEEQADDPDLHFSFYEDIFIREKLSFYEAVENAIERIANKPSGVEVDLDCIEGVLSSAATPSGITALHARQYVNWCAKQLRPAYLHVTEGATELADGRKDMMTAKLTAYLVTDFIKACNKK